MNSPKKHVLAAAALLVCCGLLFASCRDLRALSESGRNPNVPPAETPGPAGTGTPVVLPVPDAVDNPEA